MGIPARGPPSAPVPRTGVPSTRVPGAPPPSTPLPGTSLPSTGPASIVSPVHQGRIGGAGIHWELDRADLYLLDAGCDQAARTRCGGPARLGDRGGPGAELRPALSEPSPVPARGRDGGAADPAGRPRGTADRCGPAPGGAGR